MSKLKPLTQDDLATISDDFGEILEREVSKAISMKELEDLDLDIVLNYENEQLDVDVDVGVLFDELSQITQDQVTKAIDEAYEKNKGKFKLDGFRQGKVPREMIEKTYETSITVKAEEGDELAQLMEADTEEKDNWLAEIFGKVKDSAEKQLEKGKEVLVRYTEQIAVMLVTSCLVPVAVLLFVFWVSKTVIGMDIPLPKRKSLRLRRK